MYAKTLIFAVEILESSFATKDNEPPKRTGKQDVSWGAFLILFPYVRIFLFHVMINHKK